MQIYLVSCDFLIPCFLFLSERGVRTFLRMYVICYDHCSNYCDPELYNWVQILPTANEPSQLVLQTIMQPVIRSMLN